MKNMNNWKIGKTFDFCYGHRVWSQTLNPEYSLDTCLACRHLHGHQGKVIVYLKSGELTDGMVTDFKHLNWMKKFIDDVLDHKFIMDLNDPLLSHEAPVIQRSGLENLTSHIEGYYTIPSELYKNEIQALKEKYEGMIFVDFVPTSENLAKWLFEIATKKMSKIGVEVCGVQFFETPKSEANYGSY